MSTTLKWILVILAFLVLGVGVYYGYSYYQKTQEEAVQPAVTPTEVVKVAVEVSDRFTVEGKKVVDRHQAVLDYLAKKTNATYTLVPLSGFQEIIEKLKAGEIDAAWATGTLAWRVEHDLKGENLALAENKAGHSITRPTVITHKAKGITKLEEGKGKSYGERGKISSAYIMLRQYLKEKGLPAPEQFFSKIEFVESHEALLLAVLNQTLDLAVVPEFTYKKEIQQNPTAKENLVIVHQFGKSPIQAFSVSQKLNTKMGSQIKQALLAMDKDEAGKKALETYEMKRFVEITSADFEDINKAIEYLGGSAAVFQAK